MATVEDMEVINMSVIWRTDCQGAECEMLVRQSIYNNIQIAIHREGTAMFADTYPPNTPITTMLNGIVRVLPCITRQKLQNMIQIEIG